MQEHGQTVFGQGYGFANRAESIPNTLHTRFGMASGCKIFTGVAICQLVEKGLLAFDARLKDCLDIAFPTFDPNITVHHLLTHSSGIPDYFDEEVMEDFEALWHHRPMYNVRTPRDFLPMFQHERMKFAPGEQFSYSNAGFIVLGLIVEQQTAMRFPAYVETSIFAPHIGVENARRHTVYGYGVWMTQKAGAVSYYVIGEDPGARFLSTVYPEQGLLITVMGNTDNPIWPLYNEIKSIAEAT